MEYLHYLCVFLITKTSHKQNDETQMNRPTFNLFIGDHHYTIMCECAVPMCHQPSQAILKICLF